MKVFGVTGLPGSGKSIISRIAKKEDINVISMGDVIRKEAERQHCEIGEAALRLRKSYGNNVVADRCVKMILNQQRQHRTSKKTVTKTYKTHGNYNQPKKFKKVQQDIYMIEGIRSPFEVRYFKRHFKNFKVIAIHSSPEVRFNRLKRRKRIDDSTSYKSFLERDQRELKFGIGNVISTSDYMLINEGPIPKFKETVRKMIINDIKPSNPTSNRRYKSNNKNKNKQNRKPRKNKKSNKKYNKSQYSNKKRK